jgi:hypothetical protein
LRRLTADGWKAALVTVAAHELRHVEQDLLCGVHRVHTGERIRFKSRFAERDARAYADAASYVWRNLNREFVAMILNFNLAYFDLVKARAGGASKPFSLLAEAA